MAIAAEPLAANYYMQLGMTLQFHNISGEHGRPREAMYELAVRLSAEGDEVCARAFAWRARTDRALSAITRTQPCMRSRQMRAPECATVGVACTAPLWVVQYWLALGVAV